MIHTLRRTIGAALVSLSLGSTFEPMLGLAREGVVHHEPVASAIQHQVFLPGEHQSHEDAGATLSQQEPGPQHQHGTAADHCTHAHGPALMATCGLRIHAPMALQPWADAATRIQHPTSSLFHPPRA